MTPEQSANLQYYDMPAGPVLEAFTPKEQDIQRRVNEKIAGPESLDQIMDFLFDATQAVCPCDRIGLAFVEENSQRVVARWCKALYEPILLKRGYAEDLQGSSLQRILTDQQMRIINDLEHYVQVNPSSPSSKLLLREGVRSSMTCPLAVEGRVVGLLFRSSRRPHTYNKRQVNMHMAIAERLSQAVEKAWRIEQLAQANQAYTEMLGFVSHELKSPLAGIVMDATALAQGYYGDLDTKQQNKLQRMVGKANYLLGLIREYLDLARLESGELQANRREVDFVTDILTPAIEIIQPQLEDKHITLIQSPPSEPGPIQANCDEALLKIVMVNLLSNAVKYGREHGKIIVKLDHADGGLQVLVWNEGPGFGPDAKSKLFRKFSRLENPELMKQKGTGVGLYTVWRIIQLHGGKIKADARQGKWALFVFNLPD